MNIDAIDLAFSDKGVRRLVRRMRASQKRWFKGKNQADLIASKELEREVDAVLEFYEAEEL